jgi:DNA helicase-2/ATP-dependent DNA helicase PcrA
VPLSPGDVANAVTLQRAAAQDEQAAVRLVAGPGTGKSASIEERFRWLYADRQTHPRHVFGVSFTRAASKDLKLRVMRHCVKHQVPVGEDEIRVSTLHSLALTTLARANMLMAYPVRPLVLDGWEVEHIFDAEFASATAWTASRCEDIRKAREAFWSTGQLNPANYIQPDPPITEDERERFLAFHGPTTQTYACVLPGEIVRLCVDRIEAGLLPAAMLMDMQHLIVDEYQDLNPLDIRFVDLLKDQGVSIFAAGDDDQSIYAFRFASPGGIQEFHQRHPEASDHVLEGCFRCCVRIVDAADRLMEHFSPNTRIPKELVSLWETAAPSVDGTVHRWRFPYYTTEAVAIADSCRRLIDAGLPAPQIMILLSNKRIFDRIKRELSDRDVPFTPLKEESWRDTDAGRFVLGILRVVGGEDDYVALRLVLGCPRGVGTGTCTQIVQRAANNNLRYRDLFYEALPGGVFTARQITALNRARSACETIADFAPDDVLQDREAELRALTADARGEGEVAGWDALVDPLPGEMTLAEILDYIWADNSEQQHMILTVVHERLALDPPAGLPEPGVRVMTMHGAKGLQADVVFIPGLEEEVLPGPRRTQVPGLVLEGARLLYVSMTRARAALIVSLAGRRYWSGAMRDHSPSRYASHLAGPFVHRAGGLIPNEVAMITTSILAMTPAPPPEE